MKPIVLRIPAFVVALLFASGLWMLSGCKHIPKISINKSEHVEALREERPILDEGGKSVTLALQDFNPESAPFSEEDIALLEQLKSMEPGDMELFLKILNELGSDE